MGGATCARRCASSARGRRSARFSITNEANFPASPNTSDGAYEGRGRRARARRDRRARRARRDRPRGRRGRLHASCGAGRLRATRKFWEDIARARDAGVPRGARLRRPPGLPGPGVAAGAAAGRVRGRRGGRGADAAAPLLHAEGGARRRGRRCGSARTATPPTSAATRPAQADVARLDRARASTAGRASSGISDYRWFNLRDNNSDGTDLFAAVGLLRDDYSPKPAYPLFRALVGELGRAGAGAARAAAVRARTRPHAARPGRPAGRRAARGVQRHR